MVVQTDCRIGGEGILVQIDESKFGKRKVAANRRGHRVETQSGGGVRVWCGRKGAGKKLVKTNVFAPL
jgi:hypothetical protein